jgi:hypothetical protein
MTGWNLPTSYCPWVRDVSARPFHTKPHLGRKSTVWSARKVIHLKYCDTLRILICGAFRTSHNRQLTANSIFHLLERLPPGSCALQFHRHRKRITDKLRESTKTFSIDTNPGIRLHDFLKLNYVNQSNLIKFPIEELSIQWKSKRDSE